MNFRYPVFLDVAGKKCLVAGEGFEVASKVKNLVDCSANVTYVNLCAEPVIEAFAASGLIHWEPRDFVPNDLHDCFLVIADCEQNAQIFRMAEERRILCNAVDDPENCRFAFGSVHRQGDLTIAISTNGGAPAMAVRLKEWLQREVGPEYGELLELLKDLRPEITSSIADFTARRNLWYQIMDSDALARLRAGERKIVERNIRRQVAEAIRHDSSI